MNKLRIATQLTFQDHSRENISDYIRNGLMLHKEIGFDAADFSTTLLDLSSAAQEPCPSGAGNSAVPDDLSEIIETLCLTGRAFCCLFRANEDYESRKNHAIIK